MPCAPHLPPCVRRRRGSPQQFHRALWLPRRSRTPSNHRQSRRYGLRHPQRSRPNHVSLHRRRRSARYLPRHLPKSSRRSLRQALPLKNPGRKKSILQLLNLKRLRRRLPRHLCHLLPQLSRLSPRRKQPRSRCRQRLSMRLRRPRWNKRRLVLNRLPRHVPPRPQNRQLRLVRRRQIVQRLHHPTRLNRVMWPGPRHRMPPRRVESMPLDRDSLVSKVW